MKVSISYKHVVSHHAIEAEVQRHTPKLNKLLKSYEPDLIVA